MKKRISFLSLLLCLVMILLVGCSGIVNTTTDHSSQTDNSQSYVYEVTLTKDNYWKYLDWDKTHSQFTGVLSFAYYEDVVMTLRRTISAPEYTENSYVEEAFSVELNAAGCQGYSLKSYTVAEVQELLNYHAYMSTWHYDIEITSISGKVLFSIK